MTIREMRQELGMTQGEFSSRYKIPFRTIQNWETEQRIPPEYIVDLLESRVRYDLNNRRTILLPEYKSNKDNLPCRSDFIGATQWLKAVRKVLGEDVVFALDDALMCQGNFGGHSNEYLIWVYGPDSLNRFNGVVVLGNKISKYSIIEKNGLKFTNLNRTISDAFANEEIYDMQGITEAISRYYYSNNESFDGIYIDPEYQYRFEKLADDAINYYGN